jgi:hypothetical protein
MRLAIAAASGASDEFTGQSASQILNLLKRISVFKPVNTHLLSHLYD